MGIIEGCGGGKIMAGDSLDSYFSEAYLPIYFVAVDSLESDSGIVKLRVGTELDEGGIASRINENNFDKEIIKNESHLSEAKSNYLQMIKEKKAELHKTNDKIKNKPEQGDAVLSEVCYYGDYLYETGYWEGNVLMGNECDSYVCSSIIIFPPLKIKTKPIYENVVKGLNLCYENSAGVTVFPFDGKFVSPTYSSLIFDKDFIVQYGVDACFNKLANNGNGGWQFLISSEGEDHTIKLNVYVALCLDQTSLTKITSKLQLETIPKDYVCMALIDFENARPYPFLDSKLPLPKFYHIVDKTIIHEHVHKKFFEMDIKTVLNHKEIFNGKLLTYAQHFNYNPNCGNNFTNLISAINEGKNYYRNLFKMFAKDLEKESNRRTSDFLKNENYTQWNSLVQETITEYQKALIKIWTDKNLPPNESPLTNCKYTFKDKWKLFYKWKNTFED